MTEESILFHLISVTACGQKKNPEIFSGITRDNMESVYRLACRHDLAHMVGFALKETRYAEQPEYAACRNAMNKAIYRYAIMDYEYERICRLFEAEKIPFIPLKGSVLRAYYPSPWMRTSCDIDVLIPREKMDFAVGCLKEKLGYSYGGKYQHDVSLFSPSKIHLELHFSTIEEFVSKEIEQTLSKIWEDARPVKPDACQLEISDSLFYYYHIAHMAKHILNGGCGIRPFLDIWILNHRVESDKEKRMALLKKGGLATFANAMERLSEAWFSGEKMDECSMQLENYVLCGGIYGSLNNRVQIRQSKRGSSLKYVLTRIFMPYHSLKYYYPILQKYRILTPVYQVCRWIRILFAGRGVLAARELKINAQLSQENNVAMLKLLSDIGLDLLK